MKHVQAFYDELASLYHLIYPDWEASIERQGDLLATLIGARWGEEVRTVLDVSCGIGTQSLGLAARGFEVTGSDLSESAVLRANEEANARGLRIAFSACDMRDAAVHHSKEFDVVLCADNSLPHLLSDDEILRALEAMYASLRSGGGCIVTVRDYAAEQPAEQVFKPYGVRDVDGIRYVIWQMWEFDGDQYELSMYFVEDDGCSAKVQTHVMRSRYYAISIDRVLELMAQAGFADLQRLDEAFFQPVLVGTKHD